MGKNVLVIEDEPIIAEMISIILEIQGLNVISLSDTGRARDKNMHLRFFLFLCRRFETIEVSQGWKEHRPKTGND